MAVIQHIRSSMEDIKPLVSTKTLMSIKPKSLSIPNKFKHSNYSNKLPFCNKTNENFIEELVYLSKSNPKIFWQELQPRKKQIENNVTFNQWFGYARQLYEKESEVESPLGSTQIKSSSHYRRWRMELRS